ncbi:hypothetical protein [Patulibacter minatonensis]|uniref:hypothetical protein n=1 Tax=Patulibacter minatonensis TaxID=298163 RepID=UPI00047BA1C9|nr:hypothetical protein [Patulibacter minatonensis]
MTDGAADGRAEGAAPRPGREAGAPLGDGAQAAPSAPDPGRPDPWIADGVDGPAARDPYGRGIEWAILALGIVGALIAWAVYPSAGNYDSVLDLVWAREILDGHKPGFEAYAASTPHPLWVALGVPVVALFGDGGDRVLVLVSSLSLAVLAAGTVRLGRIAGEAVAPPERAVRTGRATGAVAGLLVLSSFAFGLLAAKGYLDVPFLALVAWAGAWALRSPRAWKGPALLLVLAGLLRPEAWLLAGLHWLWCTLPGTWSVSGTGRLRDVLPGRADSEALPRARRVPGRGVHLVVVLVAPVLWALMDLVVTGDPAHSLSATSTLADELGRDRGLAKAPRLLASQLVDQSRPPVFVAGLAGLAVLLLAARVGLRTPSRRVRTVLVALLLAGVATFLAAGVGGLSLIPRYLSVPVVALTVLAALAATGWLALPGKGEGGAVVGVPAPGTADEAEGPSAGAGEGRAAPGGGTAVGPAPDRLQRIRTAWAVVVVAGAVLGVGAYLTVKRDSVENLGSELRFLSDARSDVHDLIDDPAVRRGARCGPISLPTYRLVPEIRLQLDVSGRRVLARSDPRARRLGAFSRGVAITVDEDAAGGKWRRRYAQADGVPRTTKPAPPGFRQVARSGAFVASVRCG